MSIRVFLSSTREDLDADCRPSVVTGVRIGEAELVEMDSWDASHEDPVRLCQCKIRDISSHYVGLFGYRRGWAPEALGRSITEAEYDWALEYRQPSNMAVFLPQSGSELDLKLRERAGNQSASEEQSQLEFLRRVKQRTCQPFESLQELSSRVTRKLWSWKGGGLLSMAAAPGPPPPQRPRPTDEDIFALGRRRHQLPVEDTLGLLLAWQVPRVAGFLLHGPKGHGHEALASRLVRLVDNSLPGSTRHLVLHLGVPWQGNDHTALAASLAKQLGLDPAPVSPADLGREIQALLQSNDVLLEIRQAQKFEGGLPRLLRDFWRPLASGVERRSPFRFVGLISHVADVPVEADPWLQSPPSPDCDASGYDPAKAVRLPRLDPFTHAEIALWSRRWFPEHEDAAQHLFEETRGHPVDLFNLLRDDALWHS